MDKESERKEDESQFEELIQGLIDNKFGCSDNFFNAKTILGLRNNIQGFSDSGEMQLAGLGNKTDFQKDDKYRGDRIKWIEKESVDQFEAFYLKKVTSFINYLNKTCFTSINKFESHYASYEQNSFYKRHIDQFKNDNGRKYSLVLYLNEDWLNQDGGILSLYPEGGDEKSISPIGGRAVFFKSDELEHEVHPSFTRNRKSIAGWFKN